MAIRANGHDTHEVWGYRLRDVLASLVAVRTSPA